MSQTNQKITKCIDCGTTKISLFDNRFDKQCIECAEGWLLKMEEYADDVDSVEDGYFEGDF